MQRLTGKIAWVTGAGSGIGEEPEPACARAREGASVMLTGRRKEPLDRRCSPHCERRRNGACPSRGTCLAPKTHQRLRGRSKRSSAASTSWSTTRRVQHSRPELEAPRRPASRISSGRTCRALSMARSRLHLPIMRKQKDGVIINIASIAGRFVSTQPGVGYIAAKHGVVALSHSINMEECRNGIRATALCPGEVATPIIAKRPVPVSDEDKARMLQSEDIWRPHSLYRLPPSARVPE